MGLLQLLSELLSRMGGMPTLCEEGLSEQRIQGRGGGDVLKMETAAFGVRDKVTECSKQQDRRATFPLLLRFLCPAFHRA